MSAVLLVTYHGIERAPGPLFIEPAVFEAHLDAFERAGANLLTVSEVVAGLSSGTVPPRAVAVTFDDAFASVHREALPRMRDRGMRATVFCVAGFIGRTNSWPSQPAGVPIRPLATAGQLSELAACGWEVGAHGYTHAPLGRAAPAELEREIVASRDRLSEATSRRPVIFACPYGDPPAGQARSLIEATYDACCGTGIGRAHAATDLHTLPRIDAHYLRRPELMFRAAAGHGRWYLGLRRAGARARRLLVDDFSHDEEASA